MDECDLYDPDNDILKKYNNTRMLYIDIYYYMERFELKPNTPAPIVWVCINDCIRHFSKKCKPKDKVKYLLCNKYLDDIGYKIP